MPNPEIPKNLTAEDLMSDDFWRSQGFEPVHLDPNDANSFKQVGEKIEAEVKKIREKKDK